MYLFNFLGNKIISTQKAFLECINVSWSSHDVWLCELWTELVTIFMEYIVTWKNNWQTIVFILWYFTDIFSKMKRDGWLQEKQLIVYVANNSLQAFKWKIKILSQVLVAHACNPSYSGGRDQEDPGSKPAQGNWEILS
jgi:hypothetical protein